MSCYLSSIPQHVFLEHGWLSQVSLQYKHKLVSVSIVQVEYSTPLLVPISNTGVGIGASLKKKVGSKHVVVSTRNTDDVGRGGWGGGNATLSNTKIKCSVVSERLRCVRCRWANSVNVIDWKGRSSRDWVTLWSPNCRQGCWDYFDTRRSAS